MNTKTLTLTAAAVAVVVGASAVLTNVVFAKNEPAPQAMKQEKPSELPPTAMGQLKPSESTIVDIVTADDGEFDVLQAAVVKAGLVDALNGDGQLTVFAPTDAAFVATLSTLDSSVTDEVLAISFINGMDVDALTDILLYHVTEGRRNSQSVLAAPQYPMLNGMMLSQTELADKLNTEMLDISASNGIIHVINGVLMPASN